MNKLLLFILKFWHVRLKMFYEMFQHQLNEYDVELEVRTLS